MASDVLKALAAVKMIAKQFAPLATVGADLDRLEALVNHEAELKRSIDAKLDELQRADAAIAEKLAACDADIAHRQQAQSTVEAGYTTAIADWNAKMHAARERAEAAIATADARVKDAITKADTEIASLTADVAAARTRITAEHTAFVADTKTKRAKLDADTATAAAVLRDVQKRARAVVGAVEEERAS